MESTMRTTEPACEDVAIGGGLCLEAAAPEVAPTSSAKESTMPLQTIWWRKARPALAKIQGTALDCGRRQFREGRRFPEATSASATPLTKTTSARP